MEVQRRRNIDVPHSVTICKEEFLIVPNELFDPPDTSGGKGFFAGVGKGDSPILLIVVVMKSGVGLSAQTQSDMAGHPVVIAKEVLDHLTLITEAEDEFLESKPRVDFHNMPENRAIANWDHRFGPILGFLA
jgi:hypothetical protein